MTTSSDAITRTAATTRTKRDLGPKTHEKTPGQTVGPFFAFGTVYEKMNEVAYPHSPGSVRLSGAVYDGAGQPIPDALVEIWGADSEGNIPRGRGSRRRDDFTFTGYGRCATTDEGGFAFWTLNPGQVDSRAPFFAAIVFARGLPDKLHTRIYLPDDQDLLDADPFLSSLTPDERATLIATRTPDGNLHHDIRLQGEKETVFIAF